MMLSLGTKAPAFRLPDPFGRTWSLADFESATAWLLETDGRDPALAAAGASPYCSLFGSLLGGAGFSQPLGQGVRDLIDDLIQPLGVREQFRAALRHLRQIAQIVVAEDRQDLEHVAHDLELGISHGFVGRRGQGLRRG